MASCALCGKRASFGNTVAHSRSHVSGRTKRKISPNLQRKTLTIDGRDKKLTVCTRCIRTANRIRQ